MLITLSAACRPGAATVSSPFGLFTLQYVTYMLVVSPG